jgi:hypothetical protein
MLAAKSFLISLVGLGPALAQNFYAYVNVWDDTICISDGEQYYMERGSCLPYRGHSVSVLDANG